MYPPPRPRPYPRRGVRFIRRAPVPGAVGIPLGAGASGAGAGGLAGLLGGLALPLLCLGCLASLALLGLFATMIGATAYMNAIQRQVRRNAQGAGTMMELNIVVLFCALICSIYMLSKHRRGVST